MEQKNSGEEFSAEGPGVEDVAEAKRQVESMIAKLRAVVRTLEMRGGYGSRKAQITLAKRRVAALEIASGLMQEVLEKAHRAES